MTTLLLLALLPHAHATAGFDPRAPEEVFNDQETFTDDGSVRLWAEIARYRDPDTTLFGPVHYNAETEWPVQDFYAPWISVCFGTQTPDASTFLLHVGPDVALATGTPILFIPGAGDNASRGFITMATHMDYAGRPVFAVTFPHPHGDVFQQAELVADAIAVVKARTGASQIDIVSHSKGGIATAVYLSNAAGTDWGGVSYESVGTPYQSDIRRAVFIATPLNGIDTTYRWPSGNLLSLDADTAFSPSSWSTYYPYTSTMWWQSESLADQDFLPDGDDLFPGHRQLLQRQDYSLPGEMPWLGAYSLQQDWYTTYEGGLGLESASDGIDAAIEAGGHLIDHLAAAGVDPSVKLFLLAGENPIMPSSSEWLLQEYFGSVWTDAYLSSADQWSELIAQVVGDALVSVGITSEEVQGLANGDLVLGEISGPSDGLVFETSALDEAALTARGAEVVEARTANLSHLDLLYASPITGQLLIDDAGTDPSKSWEAALGERYVEADTIGWVEDVLRDPDTSDTGDDSGDSGDTAGDSGDSGGDTAGGDDTAVDDTDAGTDEGQNDTGEKEDPALGCGTCSSSGGAAPTTWIVGLAALTLLRRRRG